MYSKCRLIYFPASGPWGNRLRPPLSLANQKLDSGRVAVALCQTQIDPNPNRFGKNDKIKLTRQGLDPAAEGKSTQTPSLPR